MIVVSIIGILIVIAIPSYQKYKYKAMQGEAKATLANLYTTERVFILNYGYGAVNFYQLGFHPKGDLNYNAGFPQGSTHQLTKLKRSDITTATPYRGPLVKGPANKYYTGSNTIYGYCKVPYYSRPRENNNCFLVNGRLNTGGNGSPNPDMRLPQTVSGSQLGQANSRTVTVINNGYRDVEFMIGATSKLKSKDVWIMTDSRKLINIQDGTQ